MLNTPINAETVSAGTSFMSNGVSFSYAVSGFSLYYEITGDGTVDFFYHIAVDGANFVKQTRAIKRGLTKTSGPGGDGKGLLYFSVEPGNAIKIEAEETGSSNSVTITGKLASRHGQFGDTPRYDGATNWSKWIEGPHHEGHDGNRYYCHYSVASLGAMETPADMITLTWTTANTTKWKHFTFYANGSSGALVRLIEAPTGGAASQTEQLPMLNHDRNSSNTSGAIALDSTAGEVSYDATLATGGTTLFSEYISGGKQAGDEVGASRDEIILKQNTKYQLSIYDTGNNAGTLHIDWYEHTNR
jgi:hypothetical protein